MQRAYAHPVTPSMRPEYSLVRPGFRERASTTVKTRALTAIGPFLKFFFGGGGRFESRVEVGVSFSFYFFDFSSLVKK